MKRLFSATINSLHGLGYGFRSEAALREEMVLLAAGVLLGLVVAPSVGWYVVMIGSLLILLAVELLNTAIEKLADYITREQPCGNPQDQRFRLRGSVLRDLSFGAGLAGGDCGAPRIALTLWREAISAGNNAAPPRWMTMSASERTMGRS